MKLQATLEQIYQLAANAVNASYATKHSMKYFLPRRYVDDDMPRIKNGELNIDVLDGRFVGLIISKSGKLWEIPTTINPRKQSWLRIYLNVPALVKSVPGIKTDGLSKINEKRKAEPKARRTCLSCGIAIFVPQEIWQCKDCRIFYNRHSSPAGGLEYAKVADVKGIKNTFGMG